MPFLTSTLAPVTFTAECPSSIMFTAFRIGDSILTTHESVKSNWTLTTETYLPLPTVCACYFCCLGKLPDTMK